MGALLHWANPGLPDPDPDPYESGMTAEQVAATARQGPSGLRDTPG